MEAFEVLIKKYLEENNYIIKTSNTKSNVCYVFFSSHGLYKENDNPKILKTIHDTNRYEWLSIASNENIAKNSSKLIFLRDLRKIFYQKGINNEINSIKEIANFLNRETKGYDVYLVGSSAGGYAAFLYSNMIKNVKRVYSWGGVINLMFHSSYYESKFFNDFNKEYSLVTPYISKNAVIIHFYGTRSKYDLKEYEILATNNFDNVISVPLRTTEHAPRPSGSDIIKILSCSDSHLQKIKMKLSKKREISKTYFSIINIGLFKALINITKRLRAKK